MRKWPLTASIATLVALAASATSAAEGGPGWPAAEASFVSYDASGCIATQVNIFVHGTGAGSGAAQSRLYVALSRLDECRDVELIRAERRVSLAPGAFRQEPDLGAATLESVVAIPDKLSGKPLRLNIKLVWTAKDDAVTASVKSFSEGLGEITRARSPTQRTTRLAVASGTIKSGASNFTTAASTDASLSLTWAGRRLKDGG